MNIVEKKTRHATDAIVSKNGETCRKNGEDTGLQLPAKRVETKTEEGAVVKFSLQKVQLKHLVMMVMMMMRRRRKIITIIIIILIMMMMIYHGNVSSDGHVGVSEDVGGGERSKLRRGVELPPGHCNLYHDVYDDHLDDDYDDDDVELLPDNWDYDYDSGGDHDPDGDITLTNTKGLSVLLCRKKYLFFVGN